MGSSICSTLLQETFGNGVLLVSAFAVPGIYGVVYDHSPTAGNRYTHGAREMADKNLIIGDIMTTDP